MSVVPHLQIAFKPTQSGLCTTTPWTMIFGELVVLNPVLSFHSSSLLQYSHWCQLPSRVCPSLVTVIYFCFFFFFLSF